MAVSADGCYYCGKTEQESIILGPGYYIGFPSEDYVTDGPCWYPGRDDPDDSCDICKPGRCFYEERFPDIYPVDY